MGAVGTDEELFRTTSAPASVHYAPPEVKQARPKLASDMPAQPTPLQFGTTSEENEADYPTYMWHAPTAPLAAAPLSKEVIPSPVPLCGGGATDLSLAPLPATATLGNNNVVSVPLSAVMPLPMSMPLTVTEVTGGVAPNVPVMMTTPAQITPVIGGFAPNVPVMMTTPAQSTAVIGGVAPNVPVVMTTPTQSTAVIGGIAPNVPVMMTIPAQSTAVIGGGAQNPILTMVMGPICGCSAVPVLPNSPEAVPVLVPVCSPMPQIYREDGESTSHLYCKEAEIGVGDRVATCSGLALVPPSPGPLICSASFSQNNAVEGASEFAKVPASTNRHLQHQMRARPDPQLGEQHWAFNTKAALPIQMTPALGTLHRFHIETAGMGALSPNCRHFTKHEYEGQLSVVTEAEVHSRGVVRYALQFCYGNLSSADGVGFIFSHKLPCPKNIQRIASIFVNRTGRICVRAHSEVIKSSTAVRQFQIGDWVGVTVNLDEQTAEFTVWPAEGGMPSSASFAYGEVLTKLRSRIPNLPNASSGYFSCVVKHTGVGVSIGS